MTRNWVSAVILLVIMLSAVNAAPFMVFKRDLLHKRAVELEPCDPASTIPLTGTVDPDPAAGKTSGGKLTFKAADAYPKLFLTTSISDGGKAVDGATTTADLCAAGLKCPVAKDQQIEITTSTDVPDGVKAPIIEFNVNDGTTTIACGKTKAPAGAADGGKGPAPDGGKGPAPDGGKGPAPDGGKEPAPDGGKEPAPDGGADGGGDGKGPGPDGGDGGGAKGPPDGGADGGGDGKGPGPDGGDGGPPPDGADGDGGGP